MTKDIQHLLAFIAEGKEAINEERYRIRFIISSDKLDRQGEIVTVDAIADSIPGFSVNPCCLACHQHRLIDGTSPVTGSWDTDTFKAYKHHSEMDLEFAVDTKLGENYWRLYSKRHMRAVSIGFIPTEWHEEKDEKKGRYWVITKIELLEISCVPVGANRQALAKLKEYFSGDSTESEFTKLKTFEGLDLIIEKAVDTRFKQLEDRIDEQFDEIKSLLIPGQDDLAEELMLAESSEKGAPAENQQKAEQLLSVLENAVSNLNSRKE